MEEVACIESIFCAPGEFTLISDVPDKGKETHDVRFSVSLRSNCPRGIPFKLTFDLERRKEEGGEKVADLPNFSIECSALDTDALGRLEKEMSEVAEGLKGQPMLMDLITWCQEEIGSFCPRAPAKAVQKSSPAGAESLELENYHSHDELTPNSSQAEAPSCSKMAKPVPGDHSLTRTPPESAFCGRYISFLELDHMRDRKRYVKTLKDWANELGLGGFLLFAPTTMGVGGSRRKIMILIESMKSSPDDLREFEKRLRTQNVDVDSKGRPCKEKMMKVLVQNLAVDAGTCLGQFEVIQGDLLSVLQEKNLREALTPYL